MDKLMKMIIAMSDLWVHIFWFTSYNNLIYLSKFIPRYYEIFSGVLRSLTLPINYEKIKVTAAISVRALEGMR